MKDLIEKAKAKGYEGDGSLSSLEWWLRDQKHIHCEIFFSMFHKMWSINNYLIDLKKLKKIELQEKFQKFETYSLALQYAIGEMVKKI